MGLIWINQHYVLLRISMGGWNWNTEKPRVPMVMEGMLCTRAIVRTCPVLWKGIGQNPRMRFEYHQAARKIVVMRMKILGVVCPWGDKNGTLIGMNRLRVTLNLGAYRVAKNVFRVFFFMCFVNFSNYRIRHLLKIERCILSHGSNQCS